MIAVLERNDKGLYFWGETGKICFIARTCKTPLSAGDVVEATVVTDKERYCFCDCKPLETYSAKESFKYLALNGARSIALWQKGPTVICVYTKAGNKAAYYACVTESGLLPVDFNTKKLLNYGYADINIISEDAIDLYSEALKPLDISDNSTIERIIHNLCNIDRLPKEIYLLDGKLLVYRSYMDYVITDIASGRTFYVRSIDKYAGRLKDIHDDILNICLDNHISFRYHVDVPGNVSASKAYFRLRYALNFSFEEDDSEWYEYISIMNTVKKNINSKNLSQYVDFLNPKRVLGLVS